MTFMYVTFDGGSDMYVTAMPCGNVLLIYTPVAVVISMTYDSSDSSANKSSGIGSSGHKRSVVLCNKRK